MHKKSLFTLLIFFISLFTSCQKDYIFEDDLPEVDGNLKLNIISSYRKPSARSQQDYIFTEAHLTLGNIHILDDNDQELLNEYTGPFVCDLVNNTTYPTLPYGNISAGTYYEMQVDLLDNSEEVPSIVLNGNYHPNGAMKHPFFYSENIDEKVLMEIFNGISISATEMNEISIIIDLAYVFDGVDFGNAYYEKDGTLDFNTAQNASLKEGITNRILESFSIYQLR